MKKKMITLALVLVATLAWSQSTITKVDAEKSKIHWLAKKVTGQHEGFIQLADGELVMENDQIAGGTFTVNMQSLYATDLTGEYKDKLEGHLKSDDFFGVEKFPTATLSITKSEMKMKNHYAMEANLTIKGITNPVLFEMHVEGNTGSTKLVVDRSKFNIRYGSNSFFDNLGDKAIYDEFELEINLVF